jgi:tetratricopeptide (TPR) repeat protein
MARKPAPDGVSDTLVRLIGHADQRPLLTKYAKTEVFKNHLQDGDEIRFKRSKECDNLICNVLALDQIFGSQDWVVKLVSGSASKGSVRERIKRSREQMDAKFKAYGYWLHRMDSLNSVLDEEFDFKSSSLEDVLTASSSFTPIASTSSPYALRAVQLLETIEEDGRQSKLGVQQQSEKAWALYRLGLYEQAVDIAEEIVEADPSCSECWMLLATHMLYQKHEASKSVFKYMQQRECAEALSAHERWAEEMAEEAEDRQSEALKREREIMFSALMHWPEDDSDSRYKYKNPRARQGVRNACINWLFHLLNAYTFHSVSIDSSKLYALNGLSPEYEFHYGNAHFPQWMEGRNLPGHSLSELEINAAELIFEELDGSEGFRGYIKLRLLIPDLMMSFKLLHVRFVLGLPGYEDHRDEFISQFLISGESEISDLVRSPVLFSILFVHLAKGKLVGDLERINEIINAIELEQKNKREFLALNFYGTSDFLDIYLPSWAGLIFDTVFPFFLPRKYSFYACFRASPG